MKWNVPNFLIIVRFFLAIVVITLLLIIPYFPYSDNPNMYVSYADINVNVLNYVALFFFALAAYTDYLDGHLARKNNQITTFGKIFDPLADKILVNSVLIIFTVFGRIPLWITLIFIIRDLLVDGLRMFLSQKQITLPAQKLGKRKTMFQFIGLIVLFIIYSPLSSSLHYNYNSINALTLIPLFVGMVFSILSGISYFYNNWSHIINE